MTDFDISTAQARRHQSRAGNLWQSFQAWRAERSESRTLKNALRDLNAAQLRDIGLARADTVLQTHNDAAHGC